MRGRLSATDTSELFKQTTPKTEDNRTDRLTKVVVFYTVVKDEDGGGSLCNVFPCCQTFFMCIMHTCMHEQICIKQKL